MKNKVTLLINDSSGYGLLTEAGLIGWIDGSTGMVHYGALAEDKEHKVFISIISREIAVVLCAQKVCKKTACGGIEFSRRAKMDIECIVIEQHALLFLAKHSQIIRSNKGLEFHFNLEGDKEIPDIMPCPFCGYAAHCDEDVYSTGKLHLMCDSGDPGSCGETLIWETETTKDELEDDCKDFGDEYETK